MNLWCKFQRFYLFNEFCLGSGLYLFFSEISQVFLITSLAPSIINLS